MKNISIGFIGGGNMARSLIGGLIASGLKPQQLHVANPGEEKRQALEDDFGIHTHAENQAIVDNCDVVVFSVKPQVLKDVATALDTSTGGKLYLTIAAGIRTASLQNWLGAKQAIVRAMPNTPALVQSGATGLYATSDATEEQRDAAESIMRAVGVTLWVDDESHMDTVTALSGSGPAYFFMVMEAMEQAATQLGLPETAARLLTIQTAFGAAKLALEIEEPPSLLRENVTSPGGTTEQAIKSFQQADLMKIFSNAMQAAQQRAKALADELGQ